VSHNGAVYGFASALLALPDEKLGVAVLNNVDCSNGFNRKVVRKAVGLLLRAKLGVDIPELPEPIRLSPEKLRQCAGRYAAGEREVELTFQGGDLHIGLLGVTYGLVPTAPDRFVVDDRMGYGAIVEIVRGEDGTVCAVRTGGTEYAKGPAKAPPGGPSELPRTWRRVVGDYGWPHNVMRLHEKDGRLFCLVEWFFDYPLEHVDGLDFAFPDYGLYEGERLEFVEDEKGRIVAARLGPVRFERR
jgi:hypothetical protein